MIDDELAFATSLPPGALEKVQRMAKAMCNQASVEDVERPCECRHHCGTCISFDVWGAIAWAALQALEEKP